MDGSVGFPQLAYRRTHRRTLVCPPIRNIKIVAQCILLGCSVASGKHCRTLIDSTPGVLKAWERFCDDYNLGNYVEVSHATHGRRLYDTLKELCHISDEETLQVGFSYRCLPSYPLGNDCAQSFPPRFTFLIHLTGSRRTRLIGLRT